MVRRMSLLLTAGGPRSTPVRRTLQPSAPVAVGANEDVSGWERDHTEDAGVEGCPLPEVRPRRAGVAGDEQTSDRGVAGVRLHADVEDALRVLGDSLDDGRSREGQRA